MEFDKSNSSLLSADERALNHDAICSRCAQKLSAPKKRLSQLQLLLAFGIMQVVLVLVGFASFNFFYANGHRSARHMDDYLALSQYNTTRKHFDLMNAADPSPEATSFWRQTTGLSGIVAVDSQWASTMGLASSVPHPDDASQSLYQVNTFHSLHCLYRIRNRLIAEIPLDQWPRNDFHTMHCIDHIRKDLMCNSDLSLQGSSNYVDFGMQAADGKQCRDLGAIRDWAARHAYAGFGGFLGGNLNYDPVKVEKEVHRQRLAMERETGKKIPWDKADFTYNNVTGEITLIAP